MTVALSPLITVYDDGDVVPGAWVYVYVSATTTPVATYADADLTIANTNPIIADANGQVKMFVSTATTLRLDFYTPGGIAKGEFLQTLDPVYPATAATSTSNTPTKTTGTYTLKQTDYNKSVISQDSAQVNLILPAGLPPGRCWSYQGGAGQINYVAGPGATILDGAPRSLGPMTSGNWVMIDNLGEDKYLVVGSTTSGLTGWSIIGQASVREGDVTSYAIWRPDSTSAFPSGVSLKVSGTGFGGAGLSATLVQALTNLTILDAGVTFDGVDTLTVKPAARNPLPLHFFATPQYTALGDRTVSITISNPSNGSVSNGSVTTTIRNVSKPTSPDLVLPATTVATGFAALAGQTTIAMASVTGLQKYSTVTGSASIPAQTWVTAIDPVTSIVTLSAGLTGSIAAGTSLAFSSPGIWLDFSDLTTITKDGSNKVSQVIDKLTGYKWTQTTAGQKPTYTAASLNGLGGLTFTAGSSTWLTATDAPMVKFLDNSRQRHTIIIVAKITSTNTGYYYDIAGRTGQSNPATSAFTSGASCLDIRPSQANNFPFIWQRMSDGSGTQCRCNGHRNFVPVTLTAPAASGQKILTVDDTSGINTSMFAISPNTSGLAATSPNEQGVNSAGQVLVSLVPSATQINLNQNLGATIPSGTKLYVYSNMSIPTSVSAPSSSTLSRIGARADGGSPISAVIYEVIIVPRCLSPQEWRGVHSYLSDKWSTQATQTTSAGSSAGDYTLTLGSLTGVSLYQSITGTTGVTTGSRIVKINTSTKTITLDKPVVAPGVSNGDTITFNNTFFSPPDLLDITGFLPTFRDDFASGVQVANTGTGWQPYYGSTSFPGTSNSTYGTLGHGSSNNIGVEMEWYLDVLNYTPWQTYTPFSVGAPADAVTGEAIITATPTVPAIQNLIGYSPPTDSASYKYTSGYIKSNGMFKQQYGYYEARMKLTDVIGAWPAFWMTAADGKWPPEIDIVEAYGLQPGAVQITTHSNKTFSPTFASNSVSPFGDLQCDFSQEYVLFGAELSATKLDFYINRELVWTTGMPWDFHTPWILQANMAVGGAGVGRGTADLVTPMSMHIDYIAAWKRNPQAPSIPGGTQGETTALLAAMSVSPSGGRQTLINTLIASLKTYTTSFGQTLWDALDFLYLVAAHDAQAARINWKDPSQIGTVTGSPTFTTDRGYAGLAGSSYIDTGIVLSTSGFQLTTALNLSHLGAVANSITNTTSVAVGTSKFRLQPKTGSLVSTALWGTGDHTATTASVGGHYVATRNHYHHATFYQNGALTTGAPTAGVDTPVLDTDNLLFANGTSQIACAHGGNYLTPDDVGYLYTFLYNYLHALGAL